MKVDWITDISYQLFLQNTNLFYIRNYPKYYPFFRLTL